MKNPDFLCIGIQKAGTTWLYNNLKNHPQVALPVFKELHFYDEIHLNVKRNIISRLFDKHWMNKWWRKTLVHSTYKALREFNLKRMLWLSFYFFYPRNHFWYKALFPTNKNKITGEFTPDYSIVNLDLIETAHQNFPKTKIIILLRNPIERDWSQLKMIFKRMYSVKSTNEIDIKTKLEYLNYKNPHSQYISIINNWSNIFPNNNIFIGFYDEILESPNDLMKKISDFLNIKYVPSPTTSRKIFNKGLADTIAPEFEAILKEKHKQEIALLAERFRDNINNYPDKWRKKYYN